MRKSERLKRGRGRMRERTKKLYEQKMKRERLKPIGGQGRCRERTKRSQLQWIGRRTCVRETSIGGRVARKRFSRGTHGFIFFFRFIRFLRSSRWRPKERRKTGVEGLEAPISRSLSFNGFIAIATLERTRFLFLPSRPPPWSRYNILNAVHADRTS